MEKVKRDTKSIGERSELHVMLALASAGYLVSVPFGENQRYDLIADKDGVLSRVQVKTGLLRDGVISFRPWSSHSHRDGPHVRTYAGEIEYFGVYCPQVRATFMVPVDEVRTWGSLRWLPAKNKQKIGVRHASDFLLSLGDGPTLVGTDDVREVTAPTAPSSRRRSSVVEHLHGKQKAAGSIPADGSIYS
jgi:hypothetical protein